MAIWSGKPRNYGAFAIKVGNQLVAFSMRVLTTLMYRARCYAHPEFDREQTVLYVSNHRSFIDPPLVGTFVNGNLTYFARSNLWMIPGISTILNMVGAIPVDRSKPALETFKDTIGFLNKGRSILMFPEGTRTRSGRIGELLGGFSMIARRSRVPVVPVYLHNTDGAWPRSSPWPLFNFSRLRVYVGAPITAPAGLKSAAQDEWILNYIKQWMLKMEERCLGPQV